jgi:hypothetical protein
VKVLWRLGRMDLCFVSYRKILDCEGHCTICCKSWVTLHNSKSCWTFILGKWWDELTAIQFPHITLLQQSNRLSKAFGFSLFSSYWGRQFRRRVAQVQQASSIIKRPSFQGRAAITRRDI